MLAPSVLAVAGLLAGWAAVGSLRWARATVQDPHRYRATVAPLATDRRFHRLAGAAGALYARRRGLGILAGPTRRGTRGVMGAPGFAAGWSGAHRLMTLEQQHRRPSGRAGRRALRRRRRTMMATALLAGALHPRSARNWRG